MKMKRRDFLALSSSAIACLPASLKMKSAIAQPAEEEAGGPLIQFPAGVRVPTVEEYAAKLAKLTGPDDPYPGEVAKGKELIGDIPRDVAPYKIAHRFHEWRKKMVGDNPAEKRDRSYYIREWPVRGNPIIMSFFDATGLREPVGDTTYWCAAFVSWCICRSVGGCSTLGVKCTDEQRKNWPYQNGAASAAYRNWGEEVTNPKQGDLAVFQRNGWAGHIGFVHDVSGNAIWVLGGNQGAQNEYNGGEVNIARFNKNGGGALKFHSFRRASVLRVT
jgi:hypothetical protein